jgi:hypothetical protein
MLRWLRRLALVALLGAAVRGLVGATSRRNRDRNGAPPTIGGDTWPPVPVNPARDR